MLLYALLQRFLRALVHVFFRQVAVVGLEHVPGEGEGPVIFAGNHPNSLLDPILVIVTAGRIVHFAAKDVLFRSALLRVFLRGLGAVPVARRSDHGGAVDNVDAFDQLYAVLAAGRAVGIFPEGLSHDDSQLARLKTGAARIALGASGQHPGLRVRVVPVGLTYVHPKRFRSRVLVQFGPPIEITPERLEAWRANERDAVGVLTTDLDREMRALTVNADSWELLRVLDGVRRLYQPADITLESRVELARRFARVYPDVRDRPDVRQLFDRVSAFLDRLDAAGLTDRDLRRGLRVGDVFARILRHIVLVVFWLPLAAPGAIVHVPLATIIRLWGPRFSPRKDVLATTKLVMGLLGFLLLMFAVPFLLFLRFGSAVAFAVAAMLALSGYATLRVLERMAAVRRLGITFVRLFALRKEIESLRVERAELEALVLRAVERNIPADMVPLFPDRVRSLDATPAAPTEQAP